MTNNKLISLCYYCKQMLGVLIVNENPCCQFCAEEIEGDRISEK